MYPEYEKVNRFAGEAAELLKTDRQFKDIFTATFGRNAKKIAVEYINDKGKIKHYKYAKAEKNAYSFAHGIAKSLKDKPEHSIVVLKLTNNPHWPEVFWAILMNGFKVLLMDARTNKDGTQNLIQKSKAVAIVTDDIFKYDVKKITLDDLLSVNDASPFSQRWENEVILCSSGTTGDVKLMIYNGENFCNQICASLDMPKETRDIIYPDKYGKIRILAMIPFHHIFGFVAVFLWYTFYGKILVFPASNTPGDLLSISQKVGITHVYSVPLLWDGVVQGLMRKLDLGEEKKKKLVETMIRYRTGEISKSEAGFAANDIVKNSVQKNLLGKNVRFCISGGGYLSTDTSRVMNGIGYPLYNGYGMTELGVTSVDLSADVKCRLKGSIGKPLHNVEYKIDDKGELMVRSPITHVREIIGGEERATVLEDGFFRTGDIASVDADGDYYIKGRIKDIIINSDGENIFPDELEIYFASLPHVVHYSVLGVRKEGSTDEEVSLVLEPDNKIAEEDFALIKDIVKKTALPHGVTIGNIYLAKGKLPIANNMKIKRFQIKKAIEAGSDEYVSITAKQKKKAVVSFDGFDKDFIAPIMDKTKDLFSEVLILPKFKIENDAHWINDLGGDSMSYVELIKKIQDEFQVTIPEECYGQLTNLNEFVLEIATLLKEKK